MAKSNVVAMKTSKKVLTVADIIGADDLPKLWVETPEWGDGTGVCVRGMSGVERDDFENRISGRADGSDKANYANIRAQLVGRCIITEDGDRMFTDKDIEALGRKSGAVLDRLFDVCRKASGIGDNDVQRMAKN